VQAGTDGAISFAGTLAGGLAAGILVFVAWLALGNPYRAHSLRPPFSEMDAVLAWTAGMAGTLVDSFLGALPERRGWLNNDAVNALSTLSAALIAARLVPWF
jgi:uncharacterized protein (TIGR00297 family)